MDKTKKIIAAFGDIDFTNPFWEKYVASDIEDMKRGVRDNELQVIAFYDETGKVIFYAVYETDISYDGGLHVFALCGNILRLGAFITAFFEGMARHLGKRQVTFCTKRRAIEIFARKLGYRENEFGDFEKRVA